MTAANAPDSKTADPLGHDHYAATLWARIEQALDQDDPGDDPLVIGIFGEWGTGKSHLLELIRQRAENQGKQAAEKRAQEFFPDQVPKLTLTVPVWFHPWKYEHEPNLAIPLMMHLADALGREWPGARCGQEALRDWLVQKGAEFGTTAAKLEAISNTVVTLLAGVKAVVDAELTGTILGMAAGLLPGGGVANKGIELLRETLSGLLPGTGDDAKKKSPVADFLSRWRGAKPTPASAHLPEFTSDGKFYYRVHEQLKKITRQKKGMAVPGTAHKIQVDVHINFVVFIDDLDRCLPEKAVAVLELIKTLLNVESFAFVIALDDEVIERGIAHRYKDYRFADKKPEMPITGFEYLEKIVHLPFRLPQMTEGQARAFLQWKEEQLVAAAAKPAQRQRYFPAVAAGVAENMAAADAAGPSRADAPLLDLLLKSMESPVPRKLIRAAELLYQHVRLAERRGTALDIPLVGIQQNVLDIRIMFALLLFQLFQPELFRFFRRRPLAFAALLDAFRAGQFDRADLSDADLYRWVLFAQQDGATVMPTKADERHAEVGKLEPSQRYAAEQLRLPLFELLHEHRQAQRHSFNPLRLVFTLATQVGQQSEALDLRSYLSFLTAAEQAAPAESAATEAVPDIEVAARSGVPAMAGAARTTFQASAEPPSGRRAAVRRRAGIEPGALYLGFIAEDATTRNDLPRALGLADGEVLDGALVEELAARVARWSAENEARKENVLLGLTVLAPWLDEDDAGSRALWRLAAGALPSLGTETELAALARWAAPLGSLRRAGWKSGEAAYGQLVEALRQRMQDRNAEGRQRRDAGLILGKTGWLPEDLDAFVRIPPGSFLYGDPPQRREISAAYEIARYPVTNAQFKAFIEQGGYDKPEYWDAAGRQWLAGSTRKAPGFWNDEQFNNPIFPVVGVTWYEASAYCRWYSATKDLPKGVRVRLAAEEEWERAARHTDGRTYPWGGDFDPGCTNTEEGGTGGTTAVCTYPAGASADGVWDMSGNAWEWTGSGYETEQPVSVLRGGSYWNGAEGARCAVSNRNLPDGGGGNVGLRLVLSRANPA